MKISIEQYNLNNTESKYRPCDRQNNAHTHPQDIHFHIPGTCEYICSVTWQTAVKVAGGVKFAE